MGGLAVSRAFGDLAMAPAGVIYEPEIIVEVWPCEPCLLIATVCAPCAPLHLPYALHLPCVLHNVCPSCRTPSAAILHAVHHLLLLLLSQLIVGS